MSLVKTPSRRNLAILMAITMLLGAFGAMALPAQAGHGDSCLDLYHENEEGSETDTNPVGSTHTVTAQLRDPSAPVPMACEAGAESATSGVVINFDVDGPGDPDGNTSATEPVDGTCTTGADGSCIFSYASTRPGTDTITGWIADGTRDTDEDVEAEQVAPVGDEPDDTDVVEKTWVVPSGSATKLDCGPETSTNSTGDDHTVTCTATDQHGNRVEGAEVDAEAEGTNEPTETNPDQPDYTCTTNEEGQCSFTHGPNGSAPSNSTDTNDEGTTTYRAWLDNDGNDSNINEGDTTETPGASENDDGTDVVTKNWRHSPLNCEPETASNPAGTSHTITCSARTSSGDLAAGIPIDVEASGANDPDGGSNSLSPDFTCTTRAENTSTSESELGTCTITHGPGGTGTTNSAGTTTYRAWVDEDGNHSGSNTPSQQSHGTYEADPREGQNEATQPGDFQEPDKTDVVTKTWGASNLDCSPETDVNPTGTSHVITCRATDDAQVAQANVQIDIEASLANDPDGALSYQNPDFSCVTSSTGICTVVHGPGGTGTTNASGTTVYTAWIDFDGSNATVEADQTEGRTEGTDTEPDNTDVVEKTWIGSRLDCTPETDVNPAETAHTVTCTASDEAGTGSSGLNIDIEATGANDPDRTNSPTTPDFTCTTDTNGRCSFTHGPGGRGTTSEFGRTIYFAFIDSDNSNATVEGDTTESRDETGATPSATPGATASPSPSASTSPSPSSSGSPSASPSPSGSASSSGSTTAQQQQPTPTPTPSPTSTAGGTISEPDATDVVEKNWSAVPDRLTIEPETDTAAVGSCNPFTITALDAQGEPVQGVVVDVEQRHERSDNATAGDEPNVAFCTPTETDGANPSDVDTTRGDLGDGTDGAAGGEADRATDSNGKVTIGIRVSSQTGSNGTGNVLVTAFYENEDNDDPDAGDPQDSATKTWVPSRARTIDCDPETARNKVNTEHTVTCTVRDTNGEPAQGEGVSFTEDGPGELTTPAGRTTDSQGRVTAVVTSSEAGTQTITGTLTASTEGEPDTDECERPAGDPTDAPAGTCSDSVEKRWTRGDRVTSGPCKNFFQGTRSERSGGGEVIVGTNGADTLRGTDGDDIICGLGGKDTLIGRGGNDLVVGGNGNDIIRGNAGKDRLKGNRGEDTLAGGGGNDRLVGGIDDDILRGGGGGDTLKGRAGKDVIRGRGGNDTISGNGGDDNLNGGRGRDEIDGGSGTDTCLSGPGRDRVRRCER